MITDERLVNTIKLISLKNALDFNNNIKFDVVVSKIFSYSKDTKNNIKDLIPEIKKIISELSLLSFDEKKIQYDQILDTSNHYLNDVESGYGITQRPGLEKKSSAPQSFELPQLIGASYGNVITRFPPEPNGYPHVGHAKAAIIDEEYARKYGGKLILRFDDTNPSKEKLEYYKAISDGLEWLKIEPTIVKNTSDDMRILYDYGRKLIQKNCAYICQCSSELVKINRSNGISCDCRLNEVDINLNKFENMISGKYRQNDCIIRYRGNMESLNTAMRDPTLFRIIEDSHPRLGKKYSLWPTYDFAAPVEDSIDGVTHAFRTKEYELRNELYFAILSDLGLKEPKLIEFSRLEFEGIPVSKRKITPLIEQGLIERWDDPRLPTLMGLKRRGILPEAIRRFVLSLSITLSETKPSMEILESFNRKILDSTSLRLFFVNDPVEVHLDKVDFDFVAIKNHPTLEMGKRKIQVEKIIYISNDDAIKLKIGDTVRLMDLCNIEIMNIDISNENENENEKGKKPIIAKNIGNEIFHDVQKIQWVSKSDSMEFKIIKPLPLYKGDIYNENNLIIDRGLSESFVSTLKIGTGIQFVRYGFCRIDDDSTAVFTHR
ncbi:MAG: glutamate--tRNA ligase [Thermoproteota archaeon]|nr:glutamate--tRNA ligase [Thermoproteota archaeon]